MSVHRNEAQWNKLLDRFYTGWRGASFECADIGVGDSSFKRLVHQYRREHGEEFILSEFVENRKFSGKHKEYWLNPAYMPDANLGRRMFQQLTMQL